ncbi:MAG TPA: hypothetical protein VKI00_14580 [Mycobacterium sp.]|uniref:hypothetical protein n=1 Tax=Mycobacterium sp. TaxID=1785 RepID=UPI002D008573|nr:hypothetical protein [Mycobacterium sp.]HME76819.1 hypothetical protein [Mycobacterium sp.]
MSAAELEAALAFVRAPAVNRLLALTQRVKVFDLTTPEVRSIVAAFDAAKTRMGTGGAPVLSLIPRH